jgi:hypothetical protein
MTKAIEKTCQVWFSKQLVLNAIQWLFTPNTGYKHM